MIISMIAAMAHDRVIGKDNTMPWHLPADFAWFKQSTMGKPIIMGRKTYDSIGRLLPGRANIIISRNLNMKVEGAIVVASIDEALKAASSAEEVMIIGGGAIYQNFLARSNKLYLTYIDAVLEGDTQFPEWSRDFVETYSQNYTADDKNAYDMRFVILEKS
jgi:dihydrofolate reductase